MEGTVVGNRVLGAQSPVTIGWENIPRVEGGPFKRLFFTYFQPVMLFTLILFWYYVPNSLATAKTAAIMGVAFRALLLVLEWINPRHKSWQLTWKEFTTDLFYVGITYTVVKLADHYIGNDGFVAAAQYLLKLDDVRWFSTLPLLVQAFLITFILDFGQYWMHRAMHNWAPLWRSHSVHHFITQLNVNKGAVGNPTELFLIGLGLGGFFDFLPRSALLAGALTMAIGEYAHINSRFNTPKWWRFLFNTTEHHSLHHSQDYQSTRANFAGYYIFIDRIFGTCVDGEAELLGQEGGRRMSIREQMTFTFQPIFNWFVKPRGKPSLAPAE